MEDKQIKVWDLPVRLFHWLLVICFTVAYFTEDNWLTFHILAGYFVFGLIIFRVIWGFVAKGYARFDHFICHPSATISYLKDIAFHQPKRYIGHNPAGAAMILFLFISLFFTVLSGLATFGSEEFSGPMVNLMLHAPEVIRNSVEDGHELLANFTVFLVVLHLLGVLHASYTHKENLIKAMVTGMKCSK